MDALKSGDTFTVKWITYLGRKIPIIMQYSDGHCPFICLCNILFLSRRISVEKESQIVTYETLLNKICKLIPQPHQTRASDTLSSLKTGISFNCTFGCTEAILDPDPAWLFRLLGIAVRHAWIASNEYSSLADHSFERLQTWLISRLDNGECSDEDAEAFRDLDPNLAMDFLDTYATQITNAGISLLKKEMMATGHDSLFALYRNNHMAVLTIHNDKLYQLVTGHSLLNSEAIWERLEGFGYFTCDFEPLQLENRGKNVQTTKEKPTWLQKLKSFFTSDSAR